jgi:phosphatidylglycerophosphatase A
MEIAKTKTEPLGFADRIALVIATGAGAGFAPVAPGTAGAAEGVLAYLAMERLRLAAYYPHAIIFLFIAGVWAAHRAEIRWERDSQRIVIDEIVGQMITFGLAPGQRQGSALYIIVGFVLFRLFDIVKPFPLRRLEELKGGFGVVMDDVGAGLYALAALTLIEHFFGI